MTAKQIQDILQVRQRLEELRAANLHRVESMCGPDGKALDLTTPIPQSGQSLGDVDTRMLGLIGLLGQLEGIEDPTLLPARALKALRQQLDQLVKIQLTLRDQLKGIDNCGGFGGVDLTNFLVQSKNGGTSADVGGLSSQASTQIDEALYYYYLLSIPLRDGPNFVATFAEFSRQMAEIRAARQELAGLHTESKKEQNEFVKKANNVQMHIGKLQEMANSLRAEIQRLKEESEGDRKSISEYAGEATQKIASIRETVNRADKVANSVEAYQSRFSQFQAELDDRNKTFIDGKNKQEELVSSLAEIEGEIRRLNEQAEGMLTGAAVAGLAHSYETRRNELTSELRWARWGFYGAIGLLFLSALPLATYVVPWLGEALPILRPVAPPLSEAPPTEFLAQVLVRALLLVPAAWLARFAAARHGGLFRLREDYGYKYSVASSVEGFKKQAKDVETEVAAAAFFELTANPADRMDLKGRDAERHPNPVMEQLMKKLGLTADGGRS